MRLTELTHRRVVVWGAGSEGRAAVALMQRWAPPGSLHVIVDERTAGTPDELDGAEVLTVAEAGELLVTADVVVKSPGVSPYHGALAALLAEHPHVRCTGGTQLWFAEAAAAGALERTVAVTGSKGKSTTSSLLASLLRACGREVLLAGNVGRPPLDVLAAGLGAGDAFPPDRWHVLELSSFQCAEVRHSPRVGVLTTLFPEHLDWHLTVDRYFQDKLNLFRHGIAASVANLGDAGVARHREGLGGLHPYGVAGAIRAVEATIVDDDGSVLVEAGTSPLTGAHNLDNLCAALTAMRASGIDLTAHHNAILDGLRAFTPLAHRLEPVDRKSVV